MRLVQIRRWWPELLAALAWLATALALLDVPVWHDVVYQLWVARQLNGGAGLYSWITEVNPPVWFWMAQPIDLLAAWSAWPATRILVAAVFLLIGASLALTARFAASWTARQRVALFAAMLASLVLVSLGDIAQREHLTIIVAIPYALMLSWRAEGRNVALPLAIAVGLLAAPMFALKHYLVLIPVLLELWLLWRLRRTWHPVRAETAILMASALVYAAAVLTYAPAYLTKIIPLLQLAYGDFRMPLSVVLFNEMNLLLLVAAPYFWHFRRELRPAAQAILVVALALTISYYLQFKGWGYHISPVVTCILTAIVLHVSQRPAAPRMRWSEQATAVLMLVMAVALPISRGPYYNGFGPLADRLLQQTQPGMAVAILTTKGATLWPMVEEKGLVWPSRYVTFWMMPAVAHRQAAGESLDGALLDYVSQVRLETVEDFACNPPGLLIDDKTTIDGVPFDLLAFFSQEPRFAALMAAYSVQDQVGPYTVYARIGDLPAPTGPCTEIVLVH